MATPELMPAIYESKDGEAVFRSTPTLLSLIHIFYIGAGNFRQAVDALDDDGAGHAALGASFDRLSDIIPEMLKIYQQSWIFAHGRAFLNVNYAHVA